MELDQYHDEGRDVGVKFPGQEPMSTAAEPTNGDWRRHLIEDVIGIRRVLKETRRIAVLGIKTEEASGAPAFYVPEYAHAAGFQVVPVPVYYPNATQILGEKVYRSVASIPGEVDMVNVFRRPQDIPAHVEDIILKHPKSVWFQLGIRHDEAAEKLARAGIDVIQDRCLMVELQRVGK
jgi:predicted CoA-binding protein